MSKEPDAPGEQPPLSLYVIYNHPKDYPDLVVVRRWEVDQPKEIVVVARTVEEARQFLAVRVGPFLHNLGRYEEDDPAIAEVWA